MSNYILSITYDRKIVECYIFTKKDRRGLMNYIANFIIKCAKLFSFIN